MYLALSSSEGNKITPYPFGTGVCPDCLRDVIAKCGEIKVHHWAHKIGQDCDSWAEHETEWHLAWKNIFPKDRIEVSIQKDGIRHRADAIGKDGTVIEFQHSPISTIEIGKRESFYKNMIWIFDTSSIISFFSRTWNQPKNRKIFFRWKYFRKSILACQKPILLDFGNTYKFLLFVETVHGQGYCDGQWISKEKLIDKYL